tara:strand:- start:608 stop:979 length:372 start_codon:yes stop_codon:yes gene_type:complete
MKIDKRTEEGIQGDCVAWFRNNYQRKGVDKGIVFSIPNEAWAKMGELKYGIWKILQLTGLLAGASDLIVVLKGRVLFIEMKDYKGTQSPNQIKFQKQVENLDFPYYLVRTLKEFQKIIENNSQ